MKARFVAAAVFFSFLTSPLVFAQAQAPISEDVLACYARVESGTSDFGNLPLFTSVFVFRSQGLVLEPFGRHHSGKMIGVTLYRESSQWGMESAILSNEGTTELAAYSNENWTYPAPQGTTFTARGNFKGFFLHRDEAGSPVALWVYDFHPQTLKLKCTKSETELEQWYQAAKADAKSVDALPITEWK